MITLSEAGKIREQFKPAFAGYLTDGDISDRDVLATLLDLSVRGYIKLDMEKEERQHKIQKVILQKKSTKGLLPFEKEFLNVLFLAGKELDAYDVRFIFDMGGLHETIERNLASLSDNEIINSELEFKTPKGRNTMLYYDASDRSLSDKEDIKPVKTVKELKKLRGGGLGEIPKLATALVTIPFFLIYISFFMMAFEPEGSLIFVRKRGILIGLFLITYLLYITWCIKRRRRIKNILHIEFEDAVPFSKEKYEELFEFIQEYPLKEQRIYNEFMPFAVAFGLDTSWNKSFGIPEEPVISSKINK